MQVLNVVSPVLRSISLSNSGRSARTAPRASSAVLSEDRSKSDMNSSKSCVPSTHSASSLLASAFTTSARSPKPHRTSRVRCSSESERAGTGVDLRTRKTVQRTAAPGSLTRERRTGRVCLLSCVCTPGRPARRTSGDGSNCTNSAGYRLAIARLPLSPQGLHHVRAFQVRWQLGRRPLRPCH